tara:strand:- start:333 stop:608 length:276 start_codon:yes stop_codon:yes gene_type:complete
MESVPENNVVGGDPTQQAQAQAQSPQQTEQQQQVSLMNVPINSETDALNLMAGFLQVAQRRGAYTLAEAAKIMEAINKFGKAPGDSQTQSQ